MPRTVRVMVVVFALCAIWWSADSANAVGQLTDHGVGFELLHPSRLEFGLRLLGLMAIAIGTSVWWKLRRQNGRIGAALRASEDHYRDLVENCPDSIIVYRDDQILYVNQMAHEWLQIAPGTDLASLSVNGFIHPEDRIPSAKRRAAIASGSQSTLPPIVRLVLPSGAARSAVISTCRIEYAGEPALLSFCRDVTDQIETRQNLSMSQERLSLALDAARDGAWDWDMTTNRLNYNETWAGMLGMPPFSGEHSPETWRNLVHPDDLARVQEIAAAHVRGETPNYETEVRLRHAEGHYIWVLDRGRVVERAADGTPLRMVGTHREITARKRAEIALAARNAVAEVFLTSPREDVLENILPAVGDATGSPAVLLGLLESKHRLRLTSRTGDDNSTATHLWNDFRQTVPPDCHQVLDLAVPVLATGPLRLEPLPHSFSPALLVPVLSQDQNLGFLMVANRTLDYGPDDIEMLSSLAAYLAPILKYHLESASKESQLRQAQKMEAVGALAGGIAHDFNNILQAIMGFSTLALEEAQDMESRTGSFIANDLERVMRATHRGQELVERILLFSRRQEQETRALDLAPVVQETIDLLTNTIPATIEMWTEIATECPPVLADAAQISQVLLNLATNSFHAMEGSPGHLVFGLQSLPAADPELPVPENLAGIELVVLSVADTGCGIDAATLERLYDPFFTTKEVGKGTGLGLSVVHGIVADLGGEITVSSVVDKGTTVRIYLPAMTRATVTDKETDFSPTLMDPIAPAGRPGRIMFLDDEADIAALGKALLVKQGHQVTSFTNSQLALAALQASPEAYDLVITDLTMPRLTGLQLATEVARLRPDLPVVLITGLNEEPGNAVADHPQVCGLLHKPFGGNTLRRAVAQALMVAESERETSGEV